MVAQNAEGQLVRGLNQMIWNENAARLEAQAVMEGIRMTLDRGWQDIEVETDSHNVIAHIQGRMLSWSLQVVCENIQALARQFWIIRCKEFTRSANESANWIAKQARMGVRLDNWFQEPLP